MFGVRKVPFACTLEIYGSPKDNCSLMFNPATDRAVAEVLRNWSSVLDTIGREVNGVDAATLPWHSYLTPRSYDINIIEDGAVVPVRRCLAAESAFFVAFISFVTIALRTGLMRLRFVGMEFSVFRRPNRLPYGRRKEKLST